MSQLPLIPRKVLFSDPDRADVRISPDGKHISFLAPHLGALNIWVAETGDIKMAKPVTHDHKRGIRMYNWAWNSQHILYMQDKEGNENWVVYALDVATAEVKALTPETDVYAMIAHLSPNFPDECLVMINERQPELHDLYRINMVTGERTLVIQNDEFAGFEIDDNFQVRFASKVLPDGSVVLYKNEQGQWNEFITIDPDDANNTSICGFDKSGHKMYLLDSRSTDTAGLYLYDLETGKQDFIFRDEQADISSVVLHPAQKRLQAVVATYDRKRWTFFDQDMKKDIDYLRALGDADVDIISRTLDDQMWTVVLMKDDAPLQYYLFDRKRQHAQYLFCNRTALENLPLAKMHSVHITTRDGLNLVSYLTVPLDADPQQVGKPHTPVPLVLCVHGGPQARDNWSLNPFHQWLANRGYAVLNVNYRGSTGFGKNFIKAGNGQWGAKMHDDLLDAVNWAVAQGIADPAKICIYGGSYGGYATLVGLTLTPEVFACGIDIVGPSNLQTLAESIPPYWKPVMDRFKIMLGADPETEEGRAFLKERSPLTYADRICKPLLIGHGANDPRVKLAESDQIVESLKEKNIPVTYVVYSDEGHGFQRPENRQSFHAVTELFLSKVLGGRAEPIRDDFKGSSLEIREGKELITS